VIDRFSAHCCQALVSAESEARSLKHGHVATEHLLLGLLRVEDCVAARALLLMGVTYAKARRRLVRMVDVGAECPEGSLPFTPRVREIIHDAFTGSVWTLRLGQRLLGASFEPSAATPWGMPVSTDAPRLSQGHIQVRSEDLLLSLIANGEGVAASLLSHLDVDLEKAAVATTHVRFPKAEDATWNLPFQVSAEWPPSPPAQG
jgi:ATP-dependent Clp protease ATP-binding subunit ClpC